MILLVDIWNAQSALLQYSLKKAGFLFDTVCILYDGNLPDDAESPYQYYIEGKRRCIGGKVASGRDKTAADAGPGGKPLYFDRLIVPENWEIRGTGSSAEVVDYEQQRARIFYGEPKSRRHIRIVDWLDAKGEVRFSDHYDLNGRRFAQTVVRDHKMICKSYFDRDGREILTENLVAGAILVREDGREYRFPDRTSFVADYLQRTGKNTDCICYNSLSTPFFVEQELRRRESAAALPDAVTETGGNNQDILFWEEPIRDTIPGNMITLFNGDRRTMVAVQTRDAYEKLQKKVKDTDGYGRGIRNPEEAESMLRLAGYVYPYAMERSGRENTGHSSQNDREAGMKTEGNASSQSRTALVVTNSDQVESLEQLAVLLPDVRIEVAALTEMSSRLTSMERYQNILLHPGCSEKEVAGLIRKAGVYLDINHGGEVLDSVYRAFLAGVPVLAYESTAHNLRFTGDGNIFASDENGVRELAAAVRQALSDPEVRKRMIREQKWMAVDETPEKLRSVLAEAAGQRARAAEKCSNGYKID